MNDELKEENESFIFVISSSDEAVQLRLTSAGVYITDDDGRYFFLLSRWYQLSLYRFI